MVKSDALPALNRTSSEAVSPARSAFAVKFNAGSPSAWSLANRMSCAFRLMRPVGAESEPWMWAFPSIAPSEIKSGRNTPISLGSTCCNEACASRVGRISPSICRIASCAPSLSSSTLSPSSRRRAPATTARNLVRDSPTRLDRCALDGCRDSRPHGPKARREIRRDSPTERAVAPPLRSYRLRPPRESCPRSGRQTGLSRPIGISRGYGPLGA